MAAMVGARSRWVVTGTPIGSGGLADLHGLLRVLQHDPFQNRQLWRACIARPYAQGTPMLTEADSSDAQELPHALPQDRHLRQLC